MPNTKRTRILIAINLVVFIVAFVPGLVGREYPESAGLYVQGGASVWIFATNLYLIVTGPREALAELRQRHQRELAELTERQETT